MSTNGKRSNGTRICDIVHFYNNKRSNSMQVFIDDPYLKDGKWLTSGSVRVVLTKFMEPNNQFNAIKLTFAEATELIFRIQKALELSLLKETELQSQTQ
jgi:hypothetical protein